MLVLQLKKNKKCSAAGFYCVFVCVNISSVYIVTRTDWSKDDIFSVLPPIPPQNHPTAPFFLFRAWSLYMHISLTANQSESCAWITEILIRCCCQATLAQTVGRARALTTAM